MGGRGKNIINGKSLLVIPHFEGLYGGKTNDVLKYFCDAPFQDGLNRV